MDAERGTLYRGKTSGFMGWAFSVPTGSVRSFVGNVSPLGFELQFRAWLSPQLSLGVSGDWSTFVDERPRTTYELNEVAVTATSYNHVQISQARVLAHYHVLDRGPVLPYIGPNIGIGWATYETEAADIELSDGEVSLALGLDAGVLVPLGERASVLMANLRYSALPGVEFGAAFDNVQTVGLTLGVGL